jgi:hypothetical protein
LWQRKRQLLHQIEALSSIILGSSK